MTRQNLDEMNCSIATALDIIGEGWTILIVREAFFGTRRFEDFQQRGPYAFCGPLLSF